MTSITRDDLEAIILEAIVRTNLTSGVFRLTPDDVRRLLKVGRKATAVRYGTYRVAIDGSSCPITQAGIDHSRGGRFAEAFDILMIDKGYLNGRLDVR